MSKSVAFRALAMICSRNGKLVSDSSMSLTSSSLVGSVDSDLGDSESICVSCDGFDGVFS